MTRSVYTLPKNSGMPANIKIPRLTVTRPPPKPLPPKPIPYEISTECAAGPSSIYKSSASRLVDTSSLPPLPPKQIKHHYPLPPPSFPDAMVSVSKRLRNRRSVSPTPQYAQLQLGTRPALVNAALGRESPSKETIRMMYTGPKLSPQPTSYSFQTRNL